MLSEKKSAQTHKGMGALQHHRGQCPQGQPLFLPKKRERGRSLTSRGLPDRLGVPLYPNHAVPAHTATGDGTVDGRPQRRHLPQPSQRLPRDIGPATQAPVAAVLLEAQ